MAITFDFSTMTTPETLFWIERFCIEGNLSAARDICSGIILAQVRTNPEHCAVAARRFSDAFQLHQSLERSSFSEVQRVLGVLERG